MIYVFLSDGFEEIEAVSTIDLLRRCDLNVKTVGISSNKLIGAHQIEIIADILDKDLKLDNSLEAIVLPGGMPGALNLEKSSVVQDSIRFASEHNKIIAAICAAPSILGHCGLLNGIKATCFPGFEKQLYGAKLSNALVCVDKNFITAKGPGATIDFALKIAEKVLGTSIKPNEISSTLQRN